MCCWGRSELLKARSFQPAPRTPPPTVASASVHPWFIPKRAQSWHGGLAVREPHCGVASSAGGRAGVTCASPVTRVVVRSEQPRRACAVVGLEALRQIEAAALVLEVVDARRPVVLVAFAQIPQSAQHEAWCAPRPGPDCTVQRIALPAFFKTKNTARNSKRQGSIRDYYPRF